MADEITDMITEEDIIAALSRAKQDLFDEMVAGNGRQPAECADYMCFALIWEFPGKFEFLREVTAFDPIY